MGRGIDAASEKLPPDETEDQQIQAPGPSFWSPRQTPLRNALAAVQMKKPHGPETGPLTELPGEWSDTSWR